MVQLAVAQLAGAAVNCDGLAAALMATVALPALLTVTVTGKVALLPTPTLPKSRLDGDTATDALVEELTELQRSIALGRVGENADQPARQLPEFLVLGADGIAQAFEFVRAAFLGMPGTC